MLKASDHTQLKKSRILFLFKKCTVQINLSLSKGFEPNKTLVLEFNRLLCMRPHTNKAHPSLWVSFSLAQMSYFDKPSLIHSNE